MDDFPQKLHAAAREHVGDTDVPGLVALVARGDEVHVAALGNLAVDGRPVARDSLFRIASTTKPITAAATLAVIEEGLLGIDDPVDRWLPELADRQVLRRMDGPLDETVPAERAITIRDLLTFTFGFGVVMEMFTSPTPWPVVTAAKALRLSTIGPPDPGRKPHDQACWDKIWHQAASAISADLIPWQNRPTFQQAVEIQGHRPR